MNIEPPSDQEHRYLDAFRDASAMPEAARDRVWARLAGGPVGPVGGAAANDAGPLLEAVGGGGRGWLTRPGLLVGASVALVTGAIVLALLDADAPAEQPPTTTVAVAEQPQRHEVPAVERAKIEPEIAPASTSEPAELEPEVKAVEPAPVAKRTAPRARARTKPMPEAPTSSLADERRLIEQTHAALGRGEAASALSLLRKHEREFEAGVFVEEREALLAIATCTAGLLDDGRAAAQAFLASYPHAVLAARVRKSCALGD